MNNLEKEFVPYQESLELKELGFDEPCLGFYERGKELVIQECEITDFHFDSLQCVTPTFSQAFRWFREKYNIDAWVQPFVAQSKKNIPYLPDESYGYFIFKDGVFVCDKVDLLGPEEAELACLRKLIEIVKQ